MAFVTISRLVGKRGFVGVRKGFLLPQTSTAIIAPCHSVTQDYNHDQKNIRLQRPLSPHLTIYKFQLSSLLSISHRITGIVWSTYIVGFAGAALTMPNDFSHYMTTLETAQIGAPALMTLKFIIAFPMIYHTMNGIRHLVWDQAMNVSREGVVKTGVTMLAATAVSTLAVLLL